ncbi:MAG: RICIN domain-containing protein [Bacteroidota bacterium]
MSRGDDYYSYRKKDTNFCLDGGVGGANGQNVYLWTCIDDVQNQHWRKVDMGNGKYRLEKRNAPAFSIDGGVGSGFDGQNVYLWESDNQNPNQHWTLTPVGAGQAARVSQASVPTSLATATPVVVFPNPIKAGPIQVELSSYAENDALVTFYDLLGHQLYQQSAGGNILNIEPGILPAKGMYLIRVQRVSTGEITTYELTYR